MLNDLLLFIAGAIGGLLGGMGMGGGTLLIPILTFFFDIEQKTAQAINLLSFIPMAVVALFIHAKNGLVQVKGLFPLCILALIFSVGGSFLVKNMHSDLQSKFFGAFLCVLAIVKFIKSFKQSRQDKKQKSNIAKRQN